MRDRIDINKNMIPYSFEILLGSEWFEFDIKYNENADLFTVTLSKEDKVLVYDEPIIYNVPLFDSLYQRGEFPAPNIVALDESGQETDITYDNFGETVFLTIEGGETNE